MNENKMCCENDGIYAYEMCPGYAFVNTQIMGETYPPEIALNNGTMFPELNLPLGKYNPKEEMGGKCND